MWNLLKSLFHSMWMNPNIHELKKFYCFYQWNCIKPHLHHIYTIKTRVKIRVSKNYFSWGGVSKTQTKIYIPDITKDQANFWWQSRIFLPLPPPEILLRIWPFWKFQIAIIGAQLYVQSWNLNWELVSTS
jgi:hypothetical protein